MCECVCYCAYFYYVNKLDVHMCVLERAKHSFFALPNPLSCSVMNKICLNQIVSLSERCRRVCRILSFPIRLQFTTPSEAYKYEVPLPIDRTPGGSTTLMYTVQTPTDNSIYDLKVTHDQTGLNV